MKGTETMNEKQATEGKELIAIICKADGTMQVFTTSRSEIVTWDQSGVYAEMMPNNPDSRDKWMAELADCQWGWIGTVQDCWKTDIRLSGMDSWEIVKSLKSRGNHWTGFSLFSESKAVNTGREARAYCERGRAIKERFLETVKIRPLTRDESGTYSAGGNILPDLLNDEVCPTSMDSLTHWLTSELDYQEIEGFAGWGIVLADNEGNMISVTAD